MKKILGLLIITLNASATFASTCPTPIDIQNNNFKNWQAFTKDNGTTPSEEQLNHFKQHVNRFMLAEWMEGAPEGSAHCYYSDSTKGYAEIYLAKHEMHTDSAAWHQICKSIYHCNESIQTCTFK